MSPAAGKPPNGYGNPTLFSSSYKTCHGPSVLISAGIVKGRKMTCYRGMKDDLANAGALYEDSCVVVDRNIVTAPHYRNNPEFMREVLGVASERWRLSTLVLA